MGAWGSLALVLALGAPEAAGPDEDTQSAWEAAGWGSEPPDEEPVDATDAGADAQPGVEPGPEPELDASASEPAGREDDAGPEKVRVGDVLGGSLRLTGAYLHFDDEPLLFPGGDDALGVALGRVVAVGDLNEHFRMEFNGFFELARAPAASAGGGTFASAGSTRSSYRTRYLGWQFWENGSVRGQMGIDRAAVKFHGRDRSLDVGRFPVNYSVTAMFTTNDFFAPFSATAVNTIYKPGVDAFRFSQGLGRRASFDLVGALGYDAQGEQVTWSRAAVLGRATVLGGGFEWAALGGKVSGRWVAGGSAQGEAGPLTLRTEFHVGFPDADGGGHGSDDRPIYVRVAGGPGVTFAWQNASLMAEYMFASDGASDPADYIERALEGYSDDLPYLGRHYAGLAGGLEIVPILRLTALGLVNAGDGSGMAGLSLMYSVSDESDLIVGVFVPWGRGLRSFDPMAPPTRALELGSEFGLSPLTAYLEARVFF